MSDSDAGYSDRNSSEQLFTPQAAVHSGSNSHSSNHNDIMLSVDFSTPVAGEARLEKIKQIGKDHPALSESRKIQEVLYTVQTLLRRAPGIAGSQSNEVAESLKRVSQIINREISQLVDALTRLNLDHEDMKNAMARMSIELTLCKADNEDKSQTIRELRQDLSTEKARCKQAELNAKDAVKDLQNLSSDFRILKEKADSKGGSLHDLEELLKKHEETNRHLEEQVNNRRSLWVMKNGNSESLAKALETLAGSVKDKEVIEKSLMSLRPSAGNDDDTSTVARSPHHDGSLSHLGDFGSRLRISSAYQQPEHSSTALQSPYSPIQAGPPRAPSAAPNGRLFQSQFQHGNSSSFNSFQGNTGAFGFNGQPQSRTMSMGASAAPPFLRTPSRRGGAQTQSRYRPNAPEFRPLHSMSQDSVPTRPGTSMGHLRDRYPSSPQPGRRSQFSGRGDHHNHNHNVHLEGGNINGGALVNIGRGHGHFQPRMNGTGGNNGGPIMHVTERSVKAWTQQVGDFYSATRSFVEAHASEPIQAPSKSISGSDLWPVLVRTYLPLSEVEASSYLDVHLKDPNPKMCLVTRVIIDYVVNLVWVPSAWRGADDATTAALDDLDADIARTFGQPSALRQPILDRQAAILDTIMKQCESSPEFYKSKIEEIAGTLLNNLQPLLNRYSSPHDAYESLEAVAERAWDLSSKILTSRLTFDFRFPEIGSRFSIQSMVPIWPENVDSYELQSKHWRVALVTTPVITCRNDTGTNISAHSVSLADVICMQ